MKHALLSALVQGLLAALPPERVRAVMDSWLDALENMIQSSPTKVDDTILLPIIHAIRETLRIPDDDPGGN